jgi:hypothetical protein
VAPEHSVAFVAEHWPHEPFGWQAGAEPLPHWLSLVQALHVCVDPSQIGVVPAQSAFARQLTQVAAAA